MPGDLKWNHDERPIDLHYLRRAADSPEPLFSTHVRQDLQRLPVKTVSGQSPRQPQLVAKAFLRSRHIIGLTNDGDLTMRRPTTPCTCLASAHQADEPVVKDRPDPEPLTLPREPSQDEQGFPCVSADPVISLVVHPIE